jgi:hypothetical protein
MTSNNYRSTLVSTRYLSPGASLATRLLTLVLGHHAFVLSLVMIREFAAFYRRGLGLIGKAVHLGE